VLELVEQLAREGPTVIAPDDEPTDEPNEPMMIPSRAEAALKAWMRAGGWHGALCVALVLGIPLILESREVLARWGHPLIAGLSMGLFCVTAGAIIAFLETGKTIFADIGAPAGALFVIMLFALMDLWYRLVEAALVLFSLGALTFVGYMIVGFVKCYRWRSLVVSARAIVDYVKQEFGNLLLLASLLILPVIARAIIDYMKWDFRNLLRPLASLLNLYALYVGFVILLLLALLVIMAFVESFRRLRLWLRGRRT
jgi:hypothetical protein